jgi:hypothetical protein
MHAFGIGIRGRVFFMPEFGIHIFDILEGVSYLPA